MVSNHENPFRKLRRSAPILAGSARRKSSPPSQLTEVLLSTPRSKCQPEPEQWVVSARPNRMAATCAGTPLGASRMTFAAGSWRSGAPDTRPEPIRVVPRARVLPDVSLGTCGPHHRAVITRGNWRAVES